MIPFDGAFADREVQVRPGSARRPPRPGCGEACRRGRRRSCGRPATRSARRRRRGRRPSGPARAGRRRPRASPQAWRLHRPARVAAPDQRQAPAVRRPRDGRRPGEGASQDGAAGAAVGGDRLDGGAVRGDGGERDPAAVGRPARGLGRPARSEVSTSAPAPSAPTTATCGPLLHGLFRRSSRPRPPRGRRAGSGRRGAGTTGVCAGPPPSRDGGRTSWQGRPASPKNVSVRAPPRPPRARRDPRRRRLGRCLRGGGPRRKDRLAADRRRRREARAGALPPRPPLRLRRRLPGRQTRAWPRSRARPP